MTDLFSIVNTIADIFSRSVLLQSESRVFKTAARRYVKQITSLSKPYQHHRAESANDEQLISRFKWETALFWVVSGLLEELILKQYPSVDPRYLYHDTLTFFNWYQVDDDARQTLKTAVATIDDIIFDDFILELSEVCGQLLAQSNSRTTGEFYTPLSLAKHLIAISGLTDDEVLGETLLVDPSCGGGIILLTIAAKAIRAATSQNHSTHLVLKALTSNLYGYDIQPFAINLTRVMLLATCAPLYAITNDEYYAFHNVCLMDPLQEIVTDRFSYIIGNPPYLPVKRDQMTFVSKYDEVVYGHINLYGIFLWWAVQAASNLGTITYLVPQTLISGLYFEKLRSALHDTTRIRSITRMTDRKGVIGDADQQVMAICLKKRDSASLGTDPINKVNVIVTHNGTDIANCIPTPVPYTNLVRMIDAKPVWVISDDSIDYDIQQSIEDRLKSTIRNLSPDLVCQNGGFVWNQHLEEIRKDETSDTLPLISSGAIAPFIFTFPYPVKNPQHQRAYVKWDGTSKEKVYKGVSVLIQRITPRKTGRRLIATMTNDDFTQRYGEYLVENHVNVITSQVPDLLFGITAWINSDLAQFLFQMRNGNAQISIYELQNLPCGRNLLLEIAPISRRIFMATDEEHVAEFLQELNTFLFSYFALTPLQVSRISNVLSGKNHTL